jgi:hypothetical protein
MTVKREDPAAIRKGMADDDDALVPSPAIGFSIGHDAVANAVNGRPET